jgi:arginase
MRLTLIEVPYDCGRFGERMGRGPLVLAERLPAALAAGGHDVALRPVRLPEGFFAEVAAVQALQPAIRREVQAARAAGSLPVVLAGNCGYAALGAVAGLGDRAGVLWLDAHADFNVPGSSPSGFFDGMALATLTGRCWGEVARAFEGFAPVAEERVVLLGARDLDAEEQRMLEASAVRWLPPATVRSDAGALDAALASLAGRAGPLYLHLDLDVLDPAALRANRYATEGGLTPDEGAAIVAAARARLELAAVAVTAYDPDEDDVDRAVAVVRRLLDAAAAP